MTHPNNKRTQQTPKNTDVVASLPDALSVVLEPIPEDGIDVPAILARTGEMLESIEVANGTRFPFGAQRNTIYDKQLEGRAFYVMSAPVFAEIDSPFRKGETQRLYRFLVKLYDPATQEMGPLREARIQGTYVLSQIAALTEREFVGSYFWTLARDPDASPYQRDSGWEYPRRLAIYDPEVDFPVTSDNDIPWTEQVQRNAMKVGEMRDKTGK